LFNNNLKEMNDNLEEDQPNQYYGKSKGRLPLQADISREELRDPEDRKS
jgi:hypothetical protein